MFFERFLVDFGFICGPSGNRLLLSCKGARPVVAEGGVNPAPHPCGAASRDKTGYIMSKIFVKDLHRGSARATDPLHIPIPFSVFLDLFSNLLI